MLGENVIEELKGKLKNFFRKYNRKVKRKKIVKERYEVKRNYFGI